MGVRGDVAAQGSGAKERDKRKVENDDVRGGSATCKFSPVNVNGSGSNANTLVKALHMVGVVRMT